MVLSRRFPRAESSTQSPAAAVGPFGLPLLPTASASWPADLASFSRSLMGVIWPVEFDHLTTRTSSGTRRLGLHQTDGSRRRHQLSAPSGLHPAASLPFLSLPSSSVLTLPSPSNGASGPNQLIIGSWKGNWTAMSCPKEMARSTHFFFLHSPGTATPPNHMESIRKDEPITNMIHRVNIPSNRGLLLPFTNH